MLVFPCHPVPFLWVCFAVSWLTVLCSAGWLCALCSLVSAFEGSPLLVSCAASPPLPPSPPGALLPFPFLPPVPRARTDTRLFPRGPAAGLSLLSAGAPHWASSALCSKNPKHASEESQGRWRRRQSGQPAQSLRAAQTRFFPQVSSPRTQAPASHFRLFSVFTFPPTGRPSHSSNCLTRIPADLLICSFLYCLSIDRTIVLGVGTSSPAVH